MLLFNLILLAVFVNINPISIHLMLLFNCIKCNLSNLTSLFQYISCYCSTLSIVILFRSMPSFQYISCYCSTSLFDFLLITLCSFQYISCYCSTSLYDSFSKGFNDFNTSHVTVQRDCRNDCETIQAISIHLMLLFNQNNIFFLMLLLHFNTSHVTVQLYNVHQIFISINISIHLMLLFNVM